MCMYQGAKNWASLRRNYPEKFAFALEMERKAKEKSGFGRGLFGVNSIIAFDSDFTLEDFGLLNDNFTSCDEPSGGCFL